MNDKVKRDYKVMRKVLGIIAKSKRPLEAADFIGFHGDELGRELAHELRRLKRDGLIESSIEFDVFGEYVGGAVDGFTDEGREFYSLVENGSVWAIVSKTLNAADVDIPYPLLKEVCEEVVKRYVTSFIPEIKARS